MFHSHEYEIAGNAVHKYNSGDHISDNELEIGIKVLHETICGINRLGERYRLAYSSLVETHAQFENFKAARKRGGW